MTLDSRAKGKRGELEVVHILKAHGWPHAERTSRGVSQHGRCDIAFGPQGCAIEVKFASRLNVPAALDQLMADAPEHDVPILVHRPSRHAWMATLELAELLPLLRLRERG